MSQCASCSVLLLEEEIRFHLIASPNTGLGGEGFPLRYQVHRNHVRQADRWQWEHLCETCYWALPCREGTFVYVSRPEERRAS